MEANKRLTPFGLQLYLYIAANINNYQFALSPAAAEEYAGIKHTSFRKYLRLLEVEGYLVWWHGNVYDFYTTPRDEAYRSHPDHHSDSIIFDDYSSPDEIISVMQTNFECASRNKFSPDDQGISLRGLSIPPCDIEIDNRCSVVAKANVCTDILNRVAGTNRPLIRVVIYIIGDLNSIDIYIAGTEVF